LREHEVRTVPEAGWAGIKNGALLRLAAQEYDVFLTIDGNLKDQQNLARFNLAFIVLKAVSNDILTLRPLMPEVLAVLSQIQVGQVIEVGT
jgi:hypothetical protein